MIPLLLSQPFIFNKLRRIIAGDQKNTKNFVKKNLLKYHVKSVLDVGSGTGDFVNCIPKNSLYLGIDTNPKFIDFSNNNYDNGNVRFLVQDVTEKGFYQNKKFDAVLLISMLHHLSDEDLEEILSIVKKITKKVIIIADIIPDPPGIMQKIVVQLDVGKFVRPREEKLKTLGKYFRIVEVELISSRLAVQLGIICTI